jgi:hypothetical protein
MTTQLDAQAARPPRPVLTPAEQSAERQLREIYRLLAEERAARTRPPRA